MADAQKQRGSSVLPSDSPPNADPQEHIPPFPPEFGEDKGEFFRHYDKIQDELDDEMVKGLKENLDGLLVFAGLFAGINSAFLAFTIDLVSSNPLDDISSLLQQLMAGLKSPMSLPSMLFTPSLRAIVVNALFTLSLSSALFASFFAVLGKQWLMLYRKKSGGGVDQQRWEQLRRSLGAERWGLAPVLEVVLPGLIQTALVIFAAGFVSFLEATSETLAIFVLVPLLVVSFLWVLTVGFSLWDVSCPFRNPFAEIALKIPLAISAMVRLLRRQKQNHARKALLRRFIRNRRGSRRKSSPGNHTEGVTHGEVDNRVGGGYHNAKDKDIWPADTKGGAHGDPDEEIGQVQATISGTSQGAQASSDLEMADQHRSGRERWRLVRAIFLKKQQVMTKSKTGFWNLLTNLRGLTARFWTWLWKSPLGRMAEDNLVLQVESIKRVINISEDPGALYHAALNLRSITDRKLLELVCDDETTTRGLRECYLESLEELQKKHSRDKPNPKLLRETLAFGTAFFHVSLSVASFDDFITMIGITDVTLPLDQSEMSDHAARVSGESCRRAHSIVRKFIWLQMRGLGPQPVALTSTSLAAIALWYAINGIPRSQE
ncbi:hypothetical protein FRC01_007138, partial [Tulasnella sp. 417]